MGPDAVGVQRAHWLRHSKGDGPPAGASSRREGARHKKGALETSRGRDEPCAWWSSTRLCSFSGRSRGYPPLTDILFLYSVGSVRRRRDVCLRVEFGERNMCAKQRAGGAAGVQIFVGKADTAVLLCWWVVSNGMRAAARVGRAERGRGSGWDTVAGYSYSSYLPYANVRRQIPRAWSVSRDASSIACAYGFTVRGLAVRPARSLSPTCSHTSIPTTKTTVSSPPPALPACAQQPPQPQPQPQARRLLPSRPRAP